MPYISKAQQERARWINLIELVSLVQAEIGCGVEDARKQIQDALADSAIWPLHWEPAPRESAYCHIEAGRPTFADLGFGEIDRPPPSPPPPSSKSRGWVDCRSVSHWQTVEIDWGQGRVLDDFERDASPRMRKEWLPGEFRLTRPPRPQKAEWRTLLLDREACKRLWPGRYAVPSPAVVPQSPSGIRTTTAAHAEQECEEWIATLTERPINKDLAFEAAQKAVGNNLNRKAFERAWAKVAPSEWKAAGRRKK
jgi:hypothetical protein